MTDGQNIIKGLHDVERYLEDKEWVDKYATPHIDSVINAIQYLKEQQKAYNYLQKQFFEKQEPVKPIEHEGFYYCGKCKYPFTVGHQKFCSECGREVFWE